VENGGGYRHGVTQKIKLGRQEIRKVLIPAFWLYGFNFWGGNNGNICSTGQLPSLKGKL
jgi:hypothetical protein